MRESSSRIEGRRNDVGGGEIDAKNHVCANIVRHSLNLLCPKAKEIDSGSPKEILLFLEVDLLHLLAKQLLQRYLSHHHIIWVITYSSSSSDPYCNGGGRKK